MQTKKLGMILVASVISINTFSNLYLVDNTLESESTVRLFVIKNNLQGKLQEVSLDTYTAGQKQLQHDGQKSREVSEHQFVNQPTTVCYVCL